jgi:hypothetical protein
MTETREEPRGFSNDLRELGKAVPHKAVFGILLLAWIALFQFLGNPTLGYINTRSLFGWLLNSDGRSPDDSIRNFIPIGVLALVWWKRE